MEKTITVPFKPHPYQEQIVKSIKRFSVLICHRRFGKSTLMINLLLKWALSTKRQRWHGAYIAPFRNQAKNIAWDYLLHYSSCVPGIKINRSDLKIELQNGSSITLLGADHPDSLRGPYWDAVVFDEYAQIAPNCFSEIIRPALVDRKGWALFIGTPKGHNHFWKLWAEDSIKDPESWLRVMYKASQTNILDPAELANTRQTQSAEEYEQEFECSFEAALIGAYYGPLIQDATNEKRICSVPYDPVTPVHTSWDLGVDDSTCIWFFQLIPGGEIHFIDYHENNGHGIDHYVRVLKDKPYVYGQHLAPHDAEARNISSGKSCAEIAKSLGIAFDVVPRGDVMNGIQSARAILPRCYFDETKCDPGIQALKAYRKEYSEKLATYRDCPLHDWASHGADGFRTMATGLVFIQGSPLIKLNTRTLVPGKSANAWMAA